MSNLTTSVDLEAVLRDLRDGGTEESQAAMVKLIQLFHGRALDALRRRFFSVDPHMRHNTADRVIVEISADLQYPLGWSIGCS